MIRRQLSAAIFVALPLLHATPTNALNYIVDNEHGNYQNANGSPFNPWKEVQDALDSGLVGAGDTILVIKTGTAYETFVVSNGGTDENNKLVIKGCVSIGSPNGLDNGSGMPEDYDEAKLQVDTETFGQPIIEGDGRETIDSHAIEIKAGADFVEIKNFVISEVEWGVTNRSANNVIENVFVHNVSSRENLSRQDAGAGVAVHGAGASYNLVKNSVVYNGAYIGMELKGGTFNVVDECKVFADDNSSAHHGYMGPNIPLYETLSSTDYYFMITDGDDNDILNCDVERHLDYRYSNERLKHLGHGFVINAFASNGDSCTGNEVMHCTATNCGDWILLRGGNATGNIFEHCYSDVDDGEEEFDSATTATANAPERNIGCIQFTSGPSGNTFSRLHSLNADVAILFAGDTIRDLNFDTANGNLFDNCIFECEIGLSLTDRDDEDGGLTDGSSTNAVVANRFVFCTFVGETSESPDHNAFFRAARSASGNTIESCIITGFERFVTKTGAYKNNNSHTPLDVTPTDKTVVERIPGFEFIKCCIWNPLNGNETFPVALDTSSNSENVWEDPMIGVFTFMPGATSPCIGAADANLVTQGFDRDFYLGVRSSTSTEIGALLFDP